MILVLVEHDRGQLSAATTEAVTFARSLASESAIGALIVGGGDATAAMADELARFGATTVVDVQSAALTDYGPEAYGAAAAEAIQAKTPAAVIACGSDRGNEVMAHIAARMGAGFVANAVNVDGATIDSPTWTITRIRWGGSLHEQASLSGETKLVSVALHAVDATPTDQPAAPNIETFQADIDPALTRSIIKDRVEREAGVTLATAPVVIGGGRGVGSAEAFAPLEVLAAEMGGVVGCSRAVTNNGWRNHSDQVGQTGTRIAPTVYVAAGISGAIQHWVGAMASKNIIAINTDAEANMVTKADYAVIGDLHEVIPAITAEVQRRKQARGTS